MNKVLLAKAKQELKAKNSRERRRQRRAIRRQIDMPTIVSIKAHQPDDRPYIAGHTKPGEKPSLMKARNFVTLRETRITERWKV